MRPLPHAEIAILEAEHQHDTLDETVDGSIVVMVVVIFLMGFMAGADYVLGEVFGRIITGRA